MPGELKELAMTENRDSTAPGCSCKVVWAEQGDIQELCLTMLRLRWDMCPRNEAKETKVAVESITCQSQRNGGPWSYKSMYR